jgi:hypothetical protein
MRLLSLAFALSLGSSLLGCSSTSTTTTIVRPELVQVDPADFLDTLKCGSGADMVGSYVATLFDVTLDANGHPLPETNFPLPSSPPTSCDFPVTFSLVLAEHSYRAEIDAYDRLPQTGDSDSDLTHIHAVSLGGRLQEDGTMAHVAPRWKATCGGFPATDADGGFGFGPDASGVRNPVEVSDAGDAGDAALPGVVSYDTITTSVHNCPSGLQPAK